MGKFALACLVVAACSFSNTSSSSDPPDASIDTPPANPSVRITEVSSSATKIRPGLYGFEVTVVVENALDVELTGVGGSLAFTDGTTDRAAAFRWRDFDRRESVLAPPATTIAAGAQATYKFRVDAMPWATGPIFVNGLVTFTANGAAASATPLSPSLPLVFDALNPPIVVTEASDEIDADTEISFREALDLAAKTPGLDRIRFDPAVFPLDRSVSTVLDEAIGPLPEWTAAHGELVIDGSDAGFVLAADSNWESPPGNGTPGFRMSGGDVVIYGITMIDMAYTYPLEDLAANPCGTGRKTGGAIRVDGGRLVLQGTRFNDGNVAERSCFGISVTLAGGANHRILDNTWTGLATDAVESYAPGVEISGNLMSGTANPGRSDDCIVTNGSGGDIWIIGNICVDQEFTGVLASGMNIGTVHVLHNTFVRNGVANNSAIRRNNNRAVFLRNNLYVSNNPSAIWPDADGDNSGFDVAYEALQQNPLCNPACTGATIDTASILTGNMMLVNAAGTTRADMTPQGNSMLMNNGTVWLDRNGREPGWFTGAAPERGAIEVD